MAEFKMAEISFGLYKNSIIFKKKWIILHHTTDSLSVCTLHPEDGVTLVSIL